MTKYETVGLNVLCDGLVMACCDSKEHAERIAAALNATQDAAKIRSERRADGGLYVVIGPYDNPRPHGEAMAKVRDALSAIENKDNA